MLVPVRNTFPKNSSPGPSARQQPAMIHSQKVLIPVGDACREDGTFKDANKMMVWLNSSSDENSHLEPNEKWGQSLGLEFPDSPSEPASECITPVGLKTIDPTKPR